MKNKNYSDELLIIANQKAKERNYWLTKMAGNPVKTFFPYDYHPTGKEPVLSLMKYNLPSPLVSRLLTVSQYSPRTLHVIFLTALSVLLRRYTGSQDIITATPIYKQEIETEYINTALVLRILLNERSTFKELLLQMKQTMVEAVENQNYPVEILPVQLNFKKFEYDFPLTDVAILLANIHDKKYIQHIHPNVIFSFQQENGAIESELEYNRRLYSEGTIKRIITHFISLLEQGLFNTDTAVSAIDILSAGERKQLLLEFNDTALEYPKEKTIPELFTQQVQKNPDYLAVVVKNPETGNILSLTYDRLNRKSNQLACILKEKGIKPGDMVGLMIDRSLDMVIGILGILKAGGAYVPIDTQAPPTRVLSILEDCNISLLLTGSKIIGKHSFHDLPGIEALKGIKGLAFHVRAAHPPADCGWSRQILMMDVLSEALTRESDIDPHHVNQSTELAYTIFTSGSTGQPKGVMLEHRNVINLVNGLYERIYQDYTGPRKVALVSPYIFDASIKQIFAALLLGHSLYIVPEDTRIDGNALIRFYTRNEIDISDGTPAHLFLMWESMKYTPGRVEMNSNPGVKHLIIGGEALSRELVNDFLQVCQPHAPIITNVYGPTECCVDAASYGVTREKPEGQGDIEIPIGKPMPNHQIFIKDNAHRLLPIGVAGELYIVGAGVARGYLNHPELTAEKFCLRRHGGRRRAQGALRTSPHKNFLLEGTRGLAPLVYRTGDLAKWLPDGNILFLGRTDNQVKIRGYRVELGEIENHLLKLDMIKAAVVVSRQGTNRENYLCAYIVLAEKVEKDFESLEIREHLSKLLPLYMVPSVFVPLEKIPLLSNGKVDRKSLPEPAEFLSTVHAAPENKTQETLSKIWSELMDIPKEKISITDNFFQLGGHSLKAIRLINRIHKEFQVKLSLAVVFECPTIRGLAGYIEKEKKERFMQVESTEKREYYDLSSAQKGLYITQQFGQGTTAYNIPILLFLYGMLDREKMEQCFLRLIARHESLRMSFQLVDNEPVQRIYAHVDFQVEYQSLESNFREQEAETKEAANILKNLIQPFDLSCAPLLRVRLIKSRENQYVLLVDMHHIISDGASMEIFAREFMLLYGGEELPALLIRYTDYSQWQKSKRVREEITHQEQYWLKEFEDKVPVVNLPLDYPRPLMQSFEGSHIYFQLSFREFQALENLAREAEATLYLVVLAGVQILTAKLSGEEDIVVGTPVEGRRHEDLGHLIGMLVNLLALRSQPAGQKRFKDFLQDVKTSTLAAFENQQYPFEDLVEKVGNMINVVFVFQNTEKPKLETTGLTVGPQNYESSTAKFDITITMTELTESLCFNIEYCTTLFKKQTIERFIGYFKRIIASVLENPDIRISQIEIIAHEEKEQVLREWNNTAAAYPADQTLHRLFEQQVERTPEHIALLGIEEEWKGRRVEGKKEEGTKGLAPMYISYRELNENANQLAHLLIKKGVKSDTIVGILVERSIEMIIGILGILKAGGAYLPIDPKYPKEWINYILADSKVKLLLIDDLSRYFNYQLSIINCQLSMNEKRLPATVFFNPQPTTRNRQLAYVIYTSGSTGKPKGVLVQHGSVVNVLDALFKKYPFSEKDTYLLKTSYMFDVSVSELFGWFLGGGRLLILEPGGEKEPGKILDCIERIGISHINFVPPMFGVFLEVLSPQNIPQLSGLKYIFLAGEALAPYLVNRFNQLHPGIVLENIYGPTESTIYASQYPLSEWKGIGNIPIGKPLQNIKLYIFDKYDQLQPIGVSGELCISGTGLARGYLNRPQLTSKKFCLRRPGALFEKTAPGPHKNFLLKESNKDHIQSYSRVTIQYHSPSPFPITPAPHSPYSPIYHTGDLARWLPDGNIEFLGRIDHQVKIRGFRIELGEIENRLLKHETIKEAVVMTTEEKSGDRCLCAYMVPHSCAPGQMVDVLGLREYLLQLLPDYMIPSYFIQVDELPLTPTGKIDRRALPAPEARAYGEYIAPRDEIETQLANLWAELLSLTSIGIDNNFFQLGGHSLKATVLISKLHEEFQVKVGLADVFQTPTIRGLAQRIRKMKPGEYTSISPGEEKEFYPSSYSQKRLWLLDQNRPGAATFNMAGRITLDHRIDTHLVKKVLNRIIQRHDSFRTGFQVIEDQLVQVIKKEINIPLKMVNLSSPEQPGKENKRQEIYAEQLAAPFDLKQMPLFRTALLKLSEEKYVLLFNMHHIISDGWSIEILKQEFNSLYDASKTGTPCDMQPLGIRYKDYVIWQNHLLANKETMAEAQKFWKSYLKGTMPVLNLPYDFTYFSSSTASSAFRWVVPESLTNRLRKMAADHHASLFMVLLAGFNILLFQVTGQKDIILATPAAARQHDALKNIVGLFVNTLILRNQINAEESFIDFFKHFQENTFKVLDYQGIPLELIFSQLKIKYPAISPFFNMLNIGGTHQQRLTHLENRHMEKVQDTKFELVCYVTEYQNGIEIQCHYFRNRFKPLSIEKLMNFYKKTLENICGEPGKKLKEYRFTTKKRKLKRHN